MGTLTITTAYGTNNRSSHLVGYAGGEQRWEYFDFTIPEKDSSGLPIVSASFNTAQLNANGTVDYEYIPTNATVQTIYFKIIKKSDSFSRDNAIGSVTFERGKYPILSILSGKSANIGGPGSYRLYLFGTHTTEFYRFINGGVGTSLTIKIDYQSYTKCGNPTNVKFNSTRKQRGGKITVSWTKSSDGTSNKVAKYQIQYKINNGSWGTYESSTNSHDFTISTSTTQGAIIYARVKAIGTVSGYDSDYTDSANTCAVNYAPTSPNVTLSSNIIGYDGAKVRVKSFSSTDQDKDSLTYKYKLSTDSSYSNLTTSTEISAIGTYYFVANDGYEDSSITSIIITKNTEPKVKITRTGGDEKKRYTSATTYQTYFLNPTFKITPEGGQSGNDKYTCYIIYGDSSSTMTSKKDVTTYLQGTTLKFNDIREVIGTNKVYRISVTRNDGTDTSTTTQSNDILYGTYAPSLTYYIYNKSNGSNITNFKDYFSSKFYFTIFNDEGYDKIRVSIGNNKIDYSIGGNGGQRIIEISPSADVISYGATKEISFCFYNSNTNYFSSTSSKTSIKRINFDTKSLNLSWGGIINPFTTNGDKVSFRNFFQSREGGDLISDATLKSYGFSSTPNYVLKATYNGKSVSINIGSVSYITTDNAQFSLSKTQIYSLLSTLFSKNSNEVYKAQITLSTTNDFGDKYEGIIKEKQVTWGTFPTITCENFTLSTLSAPNFIKENMTVRANIKIESYHGGMSEVKLIGKKGNNIFLTRKLDDFNQIQVTTNENPISKEVIIELLIPEISNDLTSTSEEVTFQIVAKNQLSNSMTLNQSFGAIPVYSHVNGQAELTSLMYNNNKIDFDIKISDLGVSQNLYNRLEINVKATLNDIEILTSSIELNDETNKNREWNFSIKNVVFEDQYLPLKIIITTSTYYTKTSDNALVGKSVKTLSIKETMLYNITPTVSYRPNHLGINCSNPSSNSTAIITIGQTSNRDSIYYDGANGYCKVINFNINCGEWT